MFLLLLLFVMYCSPHCNLHAPNPARGQNTAPSSSGRAGATPQNFGRLKAVKSGVAPAHPSVLPACSFLSFGLGIWLFLFCLSYIPLENWFES